MGRHNRPSEGTPGRHCLQFGMRKPRVGNERTTARPHVPLQPNRHRRAAAPKREGQHERYPHSGSLLQAWYGKLRTSIYVRHTAVDTQLPKERTMHQANCRMLYHKRQLQGCRQTPRTAEALVVLLRLGKGRRNLSWQRGKDRMPQDMGQAAPTALQGRVSIQLRREAQDARSVVYEQHRKPPRPGILYGPAASRRKVQRVYGLLVVGAAIWRLQGNAIRLCRCHTSNKATRQRARFGLRQVCG